MKPKFYLFACFAFLAIVFPARAAQVIRDEVIPPGITRDSEIVPTGEANGICIGNTGTTAPAITLCSTLDLTGKTLLFKLSEYTVSALPASHSLAIVTDGLTSSDCTVGLGSNRVLCSWNGSAWQSLGGGGGLSDPGSNGIIARTALNTLIARTITGTSGRIVVTNGNGVSGAPTINTGSDVAHKSENNDFTASNTFTSALRVPRKTTPGDLGLLSNGEVWVDNDILRYKSNTGNVYTLFKTGDSVVRKFDFNSSPTFANDNTQGYLTGDIWLNSTSGIACIAVSVVTQAAVWDCGGTVGSVTLAQAKDNGDTIANAVDPATAVKVGNGTIFWGWYCDSSNVCQLKTMDSTGTLVAADWLVNIDAGKTLSLRDSSGTEVFGIDEATAAITKAKGLVSGFSIPVARDGGLQDSDDFPDVVRIPFAQTITQVCARTDTGTSTINLQRDDGSAANILSSDLTAATTEACTTSFVSGENILSEGHYVSFVMVTAAASGTPTKVTVSVKTARN